jgi:hypothetical protein
MGSYGEERHKAAAAARARAAGEPPRLATVRRPDAIGAALRGAASSSPDVRGPAASVVALQDARRIEHGAKDTRRQGTHRGRAAKALGGVQGGAGPAAHAADSEAQPRACALAPDRRGRVLALPKALLRRQPIGAASVRRLRPRPGRLRRRGARRLVTYGCSGRETAVTLSGPHRAKHTTIATRGFLQAGI